MPPGKRVGIVASVTRDEVGWAQVPVTFLLKPRTDQVMRHLLKGVSAKISENLMTGKTVVLLIRSF